MVPLAAVPSEFAGRVLVAKLGSAGILAEVRGVSGVYPEVLGSPEVWVEATEWSEAHELISVADALAADPPVGPAVEPALRSVRPLIALVALVVLASFVVGIRSCGPATSAPAPTTIR